MTIIKLTTEINSSIEKCFDLSIDIDFHKFSVSSTNEQAIAGRLNGSCELNDEITWQANHFGIRQQLSVKITKFNKPNFFEDQMTKEIFKSMRHEHHYQKQNNKVLMTDKFFYDLPFGFFGKVFDKFILKSYMTKFLERRNKTLKDVAEGKIAFS